MIAGGEDESARGAMMNLIGDNQPIRDAWVLFGVLQFLKGNREKALNLLSRSVTCGEFVVNINALLQEIVERRGGPALDDFLHEYGLWPSEPIGKLGTELKSKQIDPWAYSRHSLNLFPRRQTDFDDMSKLIGRYVLTGVGPPEPIFNPADRIFTLGSCFALELRNYLAGRGVDSEWLYVPESLNNTFAIRDFIEWIVTGETSGDAYSYDEAKSGGAAKWVPPDEHQAYRRYLETVSGIVLTIGLAEVWFDRQTGGVFWRGVPKSIFDPAQHGTRMSTVEENQHNLNKTIALLRRVHPRIPIILALSPVPLGATNQPESCVVADTLSKSVLRVAIDQALKASPNDDRLFYWPSFEVFRGLGQHWPESLFGEDGGTRHVNRKVVRVLMDHFVDKFWRAAPGTEAMSRPATDDVDPTRPQSAARYIRPTAETRLAAATKRVRP